LLSFQYLKIPKEHIITSYTFCFS